MTITRTQKISGIIGIIATTCIALLFYTHAQHHGPIYDFNPTTDTQPIIELFNQNWYWLVANEGFSPSFILKHRTPNENPKYFGTLKIKVLRENNQLAGFTAYYMKEKNLGQLLFLAVGHPFRGKQYGKILAEYAIDDLKKLGATKIGLWTRVSNLPAQRIYKNLGFIEVLDTGDGYLYFEKVV